jgi:hypothetical protein
LFFRAPRADSHEGEQKGGIFALAARGACGEKPHLGEREVPYLF